MERIGRQSPTFTNVKAIEKTKGQEAIDLYTSTGQKLMEWQATQINAIMSVNQHELWKYMTYGLCISRRNGKGEILAARELYGLVALGEHIIHTAHRTTTSHDAFLRLRRLLILAGYVEHDRRIKEIPPKAFFMSQIYGLESIEVLGCGKIEFRTRTNSGGLGEGFDLLIVDEAQEYTSKQESALTYTVSASPNPQVILVGTPPTAVSGGDVFPRLHTEVINGTAADTGFAEWSIPELTHDINNVDLWYEYNPSLGLMIPERNVRRELTVGEIDFNIQRLGLWLNYTQNSAITAADWSALKCEQCPELQTKRYWGVKYGHDGRNVALSVAARTKGGQIFVETIGCVPAKAGNFWMMEYFRNPNTAGVAVDGANGQNVLKDDMVNAGLKAPVLPTVKEVISMSVMFEQGIEVGSIAHMGQPGLTEVVTNCEHRPIGSGGGYGYKSLSDDLNIEIMESMVIAFWLCTTSKEKRVQSIDY